MTEEEVVTELVERAKDGDVSAYEEIVRRYQQVAGRVAYVITRDHAEADDACQEAFVKAYYALGRFRAESPLRPWLLTIVANEARNRVRSSGRRRGLAARLAEVRPLGDAAPSPEAATFAAEERTAVLAALNELSDKDREVIGFRYFLELNEAEMAAALGVARGTVKSRLARAQERLRAKLGVEVRDERAAGRPSGCGGA
ncbi:MAG TPA: sigma-70 family RNA polymerase sigma factor [Actinomycetota bacterium]|nr:sigma-70 family RNA polymerase sigma factor [Actinomycetota bacterium]